MIIRCPYCFLQGETKNLGEVIPEGVKILRSMNGEIDFTIVKATEFSLICGKCNNAVMYRKPKQETVGFNILASWGTIMTYYGSN